MCFTDGVGNQKHCQTPSLLDLKHTWVNAMVISRPRKAYGGFEVNTQLDTHSGGINAGSES